MPRSLEVKPSITSTRYRPLLEGPERRPIPLLLEMRLKFETAPATKDIAIWLRRSGRPEVKVFLDEQCTKPIAFAENHYAQLDGKVATALCEGRTAEGVAAPVSEPAAPKLTAQPTEPPTSAPRPLSSSSTRMSALV